MYKNQILFYEDYYGSCGGCGAWGEGGEPESQKIVLEHSHLFKTSEELYIYLAGLSRTDRPDMVEIKEAIGEIVELIKNESKTNN